MLGHEHLRPVGQRHQYQLGNSSERQWGHQRRKHQRRLRTHLCSSRRQHREMLGMERHHVSRNRNHHSGGCQRNHQRHPHLCWLRTHVCGSLGQRHQMLGIQRLRTARRRDHQQLDHAGYRHNVARSCGDSCCETSSATRSLDPVENGNHRVSVLGCS